MGTMDRGITEQLAEYCAGLRFSDIPREARSRARLAIMDNLGVQCWGSHEPVGRKIADYVLFLGGTPTSSLIGRSEKVPAPSAAAP